MCQGSSQLPCGRHFFHSSQPFFRTLPLGDVLRFYDGPGGPPALVVQRHGGELHVVKVSIFMDKHLLAVFLVVGGKSSVNSTFGERKVRTVRPSMVNHIVKRLTAYLVQGETGERLGCRIHENTLLPLIRDKEGQGSVISDRFVEPPLFAQLLLHADAIYGDGRVLRYSLQKFQLIRRKMWAISRAEGKRAQQLVCNQQRITRIGLHSKAANQSCVLGI